MTLFLYEAALWWIADELARGVRHTLLEETGRGGYVIWELRGPLAKGGEEKR